MTTEQIIQIITIVLGVLGITSFGFGIYRGYQKEQERDSNKITDTEKADLTLTSKIELLANEMKHLTDAIMLIKQNDLHSILEKQRDQDSQINKLTSQIVMLTTIIDERVPRKTVNEVT